MGALSAIRLMKSVETRNEVTCEKSIIPLVGLVSPKISAQSCKLSANDSFVTSPPRRQQTTLFIGSKSKSEVMFEPSPEAVIIITPDLPSGLRAWQS